MNRPINLPVTLILFITMFFDPKNSDSARLAWIRILTFGSLLINALWEDLPSLALLPAEINRPMGALSLMMHLLPASFVELFRNHTFLNVLQRMAQGSLVFSLLGWKTRYAIPVSTFLVFVMQGLLRQYSHFYHTNLATLYLAAILCFLRCADSYSLDSLFEKRPQVQSAFNYRVGTYCCWSVFSAIYMAAGLSKLRFANYWIAPSTLKSIILFDSLNPMHFSFTYSLQLVNIPDIFFTALACGTCFIELFYPLVIVSRRARIFFPLSALVMHIVIFVLQNVLFIDLILLQFIFFRPPGMAMAPSSTHPPFQFGVRMLSRECLYGVIFTLFWMSAMAVSWSKDVKYYPFSPFAMYRDGRQVEHGVIEYFRVFSRFKSGEVTKFHPEKVIFALADTRYRTFLSQAFTGQSVPATHRFWKQCARLYNERSDPSHQIAAVELQKWRWDFLNQATYPPSASLINSVVIAIPSD